jgi:hypothetical protein
LILLMWNFLVCLCDFLPCHPAISPHNVWRWCVCMPRVPRSCAMGGRWRS